jgi:hypothetical protein
MTQELNIYSGGRWIPVGGSGGGDSAITVHDGAPPQPTGPIPQALEDAFAAYADGLHFFKGAGALVTLVRQQYQTTIVLNGPTKSVAKIVKSDAGLPTPQNPSYLVQQEPDGKWMKLTSDEFNTPFGPPQMVDLFALTGGTVDLSAYAKLTDATQVLTAQRFVGRGLILEQFLGGTARGSLGLADLNNGNDVRLGVSLDGKEPTQLAWLTDLASYYTKPEVDAKVDDANLGVQSVADQIPFVAEQIGIQTEAKLALKADKTDTYTKKEVDDKLESDKDFSIANDNVLLASLTSLQEIVSNLGELGTSQIEVLAVIRGVEIEPSAIKFTDNATSPIQWKGGLSLTPVKEGDHWRLNWNDGKAIHTLVHGDEFTSANIIAALVSQDVSVSNLQAGGFDLNELGMGASGDRLITQVAGGPENTVAYLSDIVAPDLSNYVEKPVVTLIQNQMQILFDSIYTRPESDDRYAAKSDNNQNLLAKTIVAQAVGFGDAALPPVALAYTDSGEGYGDRLVLNMGLTNEYLVYKSDLDSLFPAIDTSQFSTTATVAALDARINTLESTRATTTTTASLDTRIKSLESKSAATSNINDASNAALKKSILDAVALMLAGGTKQPPADIDWTACRNFGSGNHPTAQARMIGGVIELRGTLSYPSGTTGDQSFCRLPVGFPFAELNTSVPAAAKVTSGSVAVAAYVTFSSLSANLGFDTASRANDIFLTGIKVKAAY